MRSSLKAKEDLVSVVIPTKNSAKMIEPCLEHLRSQTHQNIEIIIVDGQSSDNIKELAEKYQCRYINYDPKLPRGIFDAPHKRNYGMSRAKGNYVYWLDADMTLPKKLIAEAVLLCRKSADAVILPEDSFGEGIWAAAKQLERRCYWGDNTVESPRFYKKSVWDAIGGFDLSIGAGGDDIDLTQKLFEMNYRIERTKSIVMHNEGNLSILNLFKKRYMYGKEMKNYFYKRPQSWIQSYNPIKPAYLRNWKLLLSKPHITIIFIIMRIIEYAGGISGLVSTFFVRNAEKSSDYSDVSFQYYSTKLPELVKKYLKKNSKVSLLDLGCGDGSMLFSLKENGYFTNKKIYGVDLSPKSIALVKKIDPKINAFVDDVEKLSKIKKDSIDFIISTMVIEHVDDVKLLNTINRIHKKNGIAYLSTVFKKSYGWYFYRRNGKWVMDKTHLREYENDAQLFDLFKKNKYAVIESRKQLIWFPIADFVTRRLLIRNRELFTNNPIMSLIQKIKVPVVGYYAWELVIRKK